jgi:hypothetical protein
MLVYSLVNFGALRLVAFDRELCRDGVSRSRMTG